MPPDETVDPTAAAATTADVTDAPAPYVFPFDVPAELAAASDDDLRALHAQIREHAAGYAGRSPAETDAATLTALRACRDLAVAVTAELTGRRERAEEAAAFAAEINGSQPDEPDDGDDVYAEPQPDPEPDPAPAEPAVTQAVTAARRPAAPPSVRQVARNSRPPQLPRETGRASMTASADVPGFASGQRLDSFADAARALAARMEQYPAMTAQTAGGQGYDADKRPITVYDDAVPGRLLELRQYQRHSVVQLRRDFPADQRVRDGDTNGYAVAEHVASERRLPGGSLRASATMAVKAGRSLTAAVGWCAPSEVLYDLLELESLDGLLDLPEMQSTRGGFQIPVNGGPDFGTIYGSFASTHLTEAQVASGTTKTCVDISCPTFGDVRLGVDYFCLTGGLLQRRGYPEMVARFSRAATVALAHRINQGVIAAIQTASGASNVITADQSGDDAPSAILAAVDLAIMDAKYRNRMTFASTMEVVLPWWVLVPIRAAISRRLDTGVEFMGVTDAQILEWFSVRGAVPRFVYDWQDASSGLATGPGGSTPLKTLPATVNMLVYPAGTWVKAVQDVVALDTIYDSTLLHTNQYTAVFVEDGWAPLQMSPVSRLYNVPVDPSGVVACCLNVNS